MVVQSVCIRPAQPADVPSLMRLKRQLAAQENAECALRATEQDWLRDGFGPSARFSAFVAERDGAVVGMVTVSERYYTSWAGCTLYIQDIFVEPAQRGRGIASALLACVARLALARGHPLIELTVRTDNPARALYRRHGFAQVACEHYVAAGQALVELAGSVEDRAVA
jgi:ribosomal protein S18 acetylase RimI-like enzyme